MNWELGTTEKTVLVKLPKGGSMGQIVLPGNLVSDLGWGKVVASGDPRIQPGDIAFCLLAMAHPVPEFDPEAMKATQTKEPSREEFRDLHWVYAEHVKAFLRPEGEACESLKLAK